MYSDSAQFAFSFTHQRASKFGTSSVGVSVTNAENIIYALPPPLPPHTHMIFPFFHLGGAAALVGKGVKRYANLESGFPKKESADAKKSQAIFHAI